MPIIEQAENKRWKLHDGRALLAGLALMITGVIVAQMVAQYVTTTELDQGLNRSRLWWEIVLNLQLLSVGMIWFSYSDRIGEATGPVRRLHIITCGFVSLSAFMPTILGALSASNDWFEIRPSPDVFIGFFMFGVSFWLIGLLLQGLLIHFKNKTKKRKFRLRGIALFAPALTLGIVALVEAPGGGTFWLIFTPVMLYLQGALPYSLKAFGFSFTKY